MFQKLFGNKSDEDKYCVSVTFHSARGLRMPTNFGIVCTSAFLTILEKPWFYCVFTMGNPHGKYLSELGSTEEIQYFHGTNEYNWTNQTFDIKGKHLRDLWVKVIGLDRAKSIPSMKSLGDFRVELTHIETEPVRQLWHELDNQPSTLTYTPQLRLRSGSKPPAQQIQFEEFTNPTEELQVGQETMSLPDGQLRISIRLKDSIPFTLTRSDSDYDSKESLL